MFSSLGAQFQKLFPSPKGDADWIKSTLGALPMLQILPTAGCNDKTVASYLDAGAVVGGAGNSARPSLPTPHVAALTGLTPEGKERIPLLTPSLSSQSLRVLLAGLG